PPGRSRRRLTRPARWGRKARDAKDSPGRTEEAILAPGDQPGDGVRPKAPPPAADDSYWPRPVGGAREPGAYRSPVFLSRRRDDGGGAGRRPGRPLPGRGGPVAARRAGPGGRGTAAPVPPGAAGAPPPPPHA